MEQDTLIGEALVCYRGDQCLFNNLNFDVTSGQLLLIEGQNGSGKTSLLKLIAGLRFPDEGSLKWNGQTIDHIETDYRRQLSYIGHHDGVKRELTVTENLRLIQKMLPQQEHAISDILQQLNLMDQQDNLAATLSAGQRRRVALSRVLFSRVKLWVLDEPFTALDKAMSRFFESTVQAHLREGGIVIMTSHQHLQISDVDMQRLVLAA